MVCCCIYGCSNNSNKNKGIGFYLIPKIISWQCSKTYNLSSERRSLWLQRINRRNFNEKTIEGSRVCGAHFVCGKPSALFDSENPDWAPSLDLGYEEGEELEFRRGRWVKRKKKITFKNEINKKPAETFIMLDNLECTSDTLKLLKKKTKIILDDVSAGCSQTDDSAQSKSTADDSKNLVNCIKNRTRGTRKDIACQTDIKCEYIGHLETHVVYLRDEVQNLKQQIDQYEAYYQMMAGNDAKNNTNLVKSTFNNDCDDGSEPQPKRYKPMANYTQHNGGEESESDDDYSPLIPQVIIKTEADDNDIILQEEDDTKERDLQQGDKQQLNDTIDKDNRTSNKDVVDPMPEVKTEPSSSMNDETAIQVRKSNRPRKSTTAFDGTKMAIETVSTKTKTRPNCTAYSLWCKERRSQITKEHPDMDFSGITKFLAEMWKEVPKDEKMTWQNKANKENKGKT